MMMTMMGWEDDGGGKCDKVCEEEVNREAS